jgi:hypothetical protein
MNPKEFGWTEDQQVTVVNPTKDDFTFKVYNKDYIVEAGRMAKMPGYIAWMFVYKLSTKMAVDNGDFIHWNEEGFRKTYYDKLVVGIDDIVQNVTVEPVVSTFDVTEDEIKDEVAPVKDKDVRPKRA